MSVSDEMFLCWQCFSPNKRFSNNNKKPSCFDSKIPESFSIISHRLDLAFLSFELFFFFFTVCDHCIKYLLIYFYHASVLKVQCFFAGAVIFMAQWPGFLPHLTPRYSSWDKL